MLQWTYGWELHKLDGLACYKRKFVNKVPYELDLLDSHRPFAVCPLCPQIFSIGLKHRTTKTIREHFIEEHEEETYKMFDVWKKKSKGQLFIKKMLLSVMKKVIDFKRELIKKYQKKCLAYQSKILNLINEIDDSYGACQAIENEINNIDRSFAGKKRKKNKKRGKNESCKGNEEKSRVEIN